jgi:hypothetical protein
MVQKINQLMLINRRRAKRHKTASQGRFATIRISAMKTIVYSYCATGVWILADFNWQSSKEFVR